MAKDGRDILEVLKFELNFIEKGGYGRSPREPWRGQAVFEDSPTCMNYDAKEHRDPCSECLLMQFVPRELASAQVPCQHIPLNEAGETLDSSYRWSDERDTHELMATWLRQTIARIEKERSLALPAETAATSPEAVKP
jgi:hypothetical protein